MKRWILAILAIIAGPMVSMSQSDSMLLGLALLMTCCIVGFITNQKAMAMRLTKWAKHKALRAQIIMAVAEILLMISGFVFGWILFTLGHVYSLGIGVLFGIIVAIAFSKVPFLRKKGFTLPATLTQRRIAYSWITVSTFVLFALFGNRVSNILPETQFLNAIQNADSFIFNNQMNHQPFALNTHNLNGNGKTHVDFSSILLASPVNPPLVINPGSKSLDSTAIATLKAIEKNESLSRKDKKNMKRAVKRIVRQDRNRKAAAAAVCVGAVLLGLLLVATTCAGICLVIGGIAGGAATVGANIGLVLGGLAALGLSILGWVNLKNVCPNP